MRITEDDHVLITNMCALFWTKALIGNVKKNVIVSRNVGAGQKQVQEW